MLRYVYHKLPMLLNCEAYSCNNFLGLAFSKEPD